MKNATVTQFTRPQSFLIAVGMNVIIYSLTLAAGMTLNEGPLEEKGIALSLVAAAAPNFMVGMGMRLFGVETGWFFLGMVAFYWVLAGLILVF